MYESKLHDDGTVTYWSVYNQQWVHRACEIPDRELAAMNAEERERVLLNLRNADAPGEEWTQEDAEKYARWRVRQNEAAKLAGFRCLDHALEATGPGAKRRR